MQAMWKGEWGVHNRQSTLKLSLLRESNAQRREILHLLAKLYEAGLQWEPDLSVRRKEFVRRVDQFLKQKG